MGVTVWQFPQFETPDPLNVLNISKNLKESAGTRTVTHDLLRIPENLLI